jgi:hypothetical protein
LYRYIGPKQIADRVQNEAGGFPIRSPEDVRAWVRDSAQELSNGCVIATFVVDADGALRIADRRSEHVACSGGRVVRSAGEITFRLSRTVEIAAVSDQSTGFCPEPESWPAVAVAAALGSAGLAAPDGFSRSCEFRRCVKCGGLTLVKDGEFECAICGAELPAKYNCQ